MNDEYCKEILTAIENDEDDDILSMIEDRDELNYFIEYLIKYSINILNTSFYKNLLSQYSIDDLYISHFTYSEYFMFFEDHYGFEKVYERLFREDDWMCPILNLDQNPKEDMLEIMKKYIGVYIERNSN